MDKKKLITLSIAFVALIFLFAIIGACLPSNAWLAMFILCLIFSIATIVCLIFCLTSKKSDNLSK